MRSAYKTQRPIYTLSLLETVNYKQCPIWTRFFYCDV